MEPLDDPYDLLARLSDLARAERSALAALARAEGATAEDAVDCVQEALCTVLASARRGAPAPVEALGAAVAETVRNAARNRRRRHFRARPHDDIDLHPLPADDGPATDEAIARAEEHVRLRACVAELCEIQRAVVTLRMLEEQPGEDVAQALGISPGHVAVLLYRAKRALRACMTSPRTGTCS
jgi:RNA polymerase sigma-70 factor (ECF subfamily)